MRKRMTTTTWTTSAGPSISHDGTPPPLVYPLHHHRLCRHRRRLRCYFNNIIIIINSGVSRRLNRRPPPTVSSATRPPLTRARSGTPPSHLILTTTIIKITTTATLSTTTIQPILSQPITTNTRIPADPRLIRFPRALPPARPCRLIPPMPTLLCHRNRPGSKTLPLLPPLLPLSYITIISSFSDKMTPTKEPFRTLALVAHHHPPHLIRHSL